MNKRIIITTLITLLIFVTGCSPQEYEVNIKIEPEDVGELVGEGTYKVGEEVELAAIPKEGYEFENWEIDGEKFSEEKKI